MHIVFLQCWHTLVHRPASLCIFFLRRRREGRKPPDKNKFCNRSSAARVSPTRSPLFPHHLFQFVTLTFWLHNSCSAFLVIFSCFFPPTLALIPHQNVQIAFMYACQHFSETGLRYCLFCRWEVYCYKQLILYP